MQFDASAARLCLQEISKSYHVPVLKQVDLQIGVGEIHALLGANGAGKSTLSKIVAGMTRADSGRMLIDGEIYLPQSKFHSEKFGVQVVHQELSRISTLSVAENLFLGHLPSVLGILARKKLNRLAEAALKRFDLQDLQPDQSIHGLGVGKKQLLEIAAALLRPCRVLILDEPTAALSASETERLFVWLKDLQHQGTAILYISHRLEEIKRIADRITVLRDGKVVLQSSAAQTSVPHLIRQMSGLDAELPSVPFTSYRVSDQILMEVQSISDGRRICDVSFKLYAGERLGIAGLVGSGRTEVLETIFGVRPATQGSVRTYAELPNKRKRNSTSLAHPADAVAAGLAMVPEDRKRNGLMMDLSIAVNTTIVALESQFARCGLVRSALERLRTKEVCQRLQVRCKQIHQKVSRLSGGNQQKVVLAKWLVKGARIWLLDEPTRGIDIQARSLIYQTVNQNAQNGHGIILVSSDLEELMQWSDRIMVISNGRMGPVFERGQWTRQGLMDAMFSGYGVRK